MFWGLSCRRSRLDVTIQMTSTAGHRVGNAVLLFVFALEHLPTKPIVTDLNDVAMLLLRGSTTAQIPNSSARHCPSSSANTHHWCSPRSLNASTVAIQKGRPPSSDWSCCRSSSSRPLAVAIVAVAAQYVAVAVITSGCLWDTLKDH